MLAIVSGAGGAANTKYVHSNHLYSPAALTDNTGAVVERYKYDAYGKRTIYDAAGTVVRTASSYGFPVCFTGRYEDAETGLLYFRARYYSTSQGRFVGRDPLGYMDGMNEYVSYLVPNLLDPSGTLTLGFYINELPEPGLYEVRRKNNREIIPAAKQYLGSMGDELLERLIKKGKVTFNKEVFKGSAYEYKKLVSRELIYYWLFYTPDYAKRKDKNAEAANKGQDWRDNQTSLEVNGEVDVAIKEISQSINGQKANKMKYPWDNMYVFFHSNIGRTFDPPAPGQPRPYGASSFDMSNIDFANALGAGTGAYCATCYLKDKIFEHTVQVETADWWTVPKNVLPNDCMEFHFMPTSASDVSGRRPPTGGWAEGPTFPIPSPAR